MAMYTSCLAIGHTLLAKSIKFNTIMCCLQAAALLCEPRRLVLLKVDMILFACTLDSREEQYSLIAVLLDWLIVDIYTGDRKNE
eukprot:8574549-Ditylum_brightwellii.AAC.1